MGAMEIILLALGIVIFVASFVLPEKKRQLSQEECRVSDEKIKELVEKELSSVKDKISGMVDESIAYGTEKTERALDRLTNEKIMAVNEYSDTVLAEIHKNHEEVVFLYDMLNDKQKSLKNAAQEAEKMAKEIKNLADLSLAAIEEVGRNRSAKSGKAAAKAEERAEEKGISPRPAGKEAEADTGATVNDLPREDGALVVEESAETTAKAAKTTKAAGKAGGGRSAGRQGELPQVGIAFGTAGENGKNNNEKILALHKEGKSNMAIAKELGLGIGEVKLVIDLFEGI